ncbi:citrinin biosynthesis oxygenase CtnA [Phlyctema vagabunda]|uniref:Citrinin biosynthesis oxygenase CtnA n=1 Tax=Phlyctema vagabunda TaxID=108571 RepID=A0ABR4PTT8_9HELO
MSTVNTIPTIDISPWISSDSSDEDRDAVVSALRDASRTYGFFQLVGHGIPLADQEGVFKCAERLFSISLEEKMEVSIKNALGSANRGYEAFQGQTLQTGMLPDMKEGFFIGAEVPASDPRAGTFLTGPNLWPKSLPRESFQEPLEAYRMKMVELAEIVLKALARGLPSPATPDIFNEFMIEPSGNLRLLHYPPQTSVDERQLGAGAHTDFGGITFLLQQPGTSGLQVLYPPTEEWIEVPVKVNSFVVNIGDLLQKWTGSYYRSAWHRVINTGDNHRYSAPFFFNGNMKLQIAPIDGAPRVTVEEHIKGKLVESHPQRKAD